MKYGLLFSIQLFCIVACGQIEPQNRPQPELTNADSIVIVEQKTVNNIIHAIKLHYAFFYGGMTRMEENLTDSTIAITYYMITKADNYEEHLISFSIPTKDLLKTNKYPIIKGDLNGDGLEDLVVVVKTESIGLLSDDLFLFLKTKQGYSLVNVSKSHDISGFIDGYFVIERIKDGYLEGVSHVYAEKDQRCCPSIKYKVQLNLSNGKIWAKSSIRLN